MRRYSICCRLAFVLAVFVYAPQARAQFSADFQTNTISGVVSNWVGNGTYVVGSNTFLNTLRIVSTGVLSNGSGFVGYETIASNSTVLVSDTGSRWTNRFDMYLGIGSMGNRLIVSNQGAVFNGNTYIGFNSTGHSNTALISDTGSVWRVRTNLFVGYFTAGNQLIVSNGAVVSDLAGTIGFTNAPGNSAWVGGAGSLWSNAFSLFVGYHNAGNQLIVTNSGTVFSGDGYIGTAFAGSNNTAIVAGGATWRTTNTLNVGYQGSSNTLFVTGGGKVFRQSGYIGTNAASSGNSVLVADTGSLWSNTVNLFVGYLGSDNQLTVTNGASVLDQAGAVGFTNLSTRNSAFIEGPGSTWSNAVFCYVGYFCAGNELIVSNGATLFSGTGYVGAGSPSSDNTATIAGSGARWANTNFLYVGFVGSSNKLVIADGGRASAPETRIGFDPLASNNIAVVTGSGALLSNSVNTIVGYGGTSNQMIVAAGGRVFDQIGNVGYTNQSSRNTATVTGSGSVWSNTTTMYVGFKSASNRLVVADGGKVFDNEGYIGANFPASNNYATVTGLGSIWENVANLYVGYMGTNNQLTVADGGKASATAGTIGFTNFSPRSMAWITGPGSVWSNGQFTYVGYNGAFNQLIVSNGGSAWSGLGCIGAFNLASNNTVTVTGTGSVWTTTNQLYVGYSGDRNSLVIADGGTVRSLAGTVGYDTVTVSNSATVTGSGSLWTNSLNLVVGTFGVGNTLTITNGGAVVNYIGYIGSTTVSHSNLVIVTGAGSVWSNLAGMFVGYGGRGNRLIIADSGKVVGPSHYIGNTGATNSTALVTGPGSAWRTGTNITDQLVVGYNSRGNSLVISNGGAILARRSTIGDASFGAGYFNTGIVTGTSSIWSNTGTFSIGVYGYRNHLTITNGGAVFDTDANLGDGGFDSGSNNTALVTDSGSLWDNAGSLTIGLGGNSNRLTVANLGQVRAANFLIGQGTVGNRLILSNGLVNAGSLTIDFGNFLTGAGTIDAPVLNSGTIDANLSGGTLTFLGAVKNTGNLRASGGGIIEFFGPVFNLGTTNFTGGTAIFHSTFFSAQGTTNRWTFAGDGLWQQAARWSLGVTPSSTNAVVLITNTTTKTLTVDASTFAAAPGSVSNFNVTVAGPSNVTNTLVIANTPAPFLAVNLNILNNANATISNATLAVGLAGTGSLTVDGGFHVEAGGLLDAREAQAFTTTKGLTIDGGGVLSAGATLAGGTTTVTGVSAIWSNAALAISFGRLVISNGAQVISASGSAFNGYNATAVVTGPGTLWRIDAGNFNIGVISAGGNRLFITDGAVVDCQSALVDIFEFNDQVTVAGNGALWNVRGALAIGVGSSGNDAVNISTGGTVIASAIQLNTAIATNLLNLAGGNLYVTNVAGNGQLNLASQFLLNTGTATVDSLVIVTNSGTGWMSFRAGTLHSAATVVTNDQQFVVGDGTNSANFHLLGGVHSFNDGLRIRTNAMLSGCGTINGTVVINAGGTVVADCSPLVFTGSVTNNGTMRAINGNVLEAYGTVVNNGVIDLINGGITNFHGTFINNGTILTSNDVRIVEISASGDDMLVKVQSYTGHDFQLQSRDSITAGVWTDTGAPQPGTGSILTFTDPGGATNIPSRFYLFRVTP